jgi:peptide chain release factor 1
VDFPTIAGELGIRSIQALAQHVEHMPLDLFADWYRDRRSGIGYRGAADQPVRGLHRDGAHGVVTEMLRDLERHRLAERFELHLHRQRVEQLRQLVAGELDVHHRPGDPDYSADPRFGGGTVGVGRLLRCTHVSYRFPRRTALPHRRRSR